MSYTLSDFCVPVAVKVTEDIVSVDKGWIAGAFILGLILGIAATAVFIPCCLRDCAKRKRQEDEEAILAQSGETAQLVHGGQIVAAEEIIDKKKKRKRGTKLKKKKKNESDEDDSESDGEMPEGDLDPSMSRGMIDVLLQPEGVAVDTELNEQDMDAILAMEKKMDDERDVIFLRSLGILLAKQISKKKMDESFYDSFMKKLEEDTKDMKNICDREMNTAEEELKNNPKFNKDPERLEKEMDKLQSEYNNKLEHMKKMQKEEVRNTLIKSSGLSENDVDEIMDRLMMNRSNYEKKVGDELSRQARNLEERYARRKQIADYRRMQNEFNRDEVDNKVKSFDEILEKNVEQGLLLDRQKDELLKEYAENVKRIQEHSNQQQMRDEMELADKLRLRRQKRMLKLTEKQNKEKATFIQRTEKGVPAKDFAQSYHDLILRHTAEQEEASTELDQTEIAELENLRKNIATACDKAIQAEDRTVIDRLRNNANMADRDVNKIIKLHQQQMSRFQEQKDRERQRVLGKLQDRLAHKMQEVEDEEQQNMMADESLKQHQKTMVTKVLESNMELPEDAKEKILREHEHNMQELSNKLQQNRMKQQRNLENRLLQRRQKLEELAKERKNLDMLNPEEKVKNLDKKKEALDEQIQSEEKKIEEDKQRAIEDLRKQLAIETEEAIKQQDADLGVLIGRLEVGQARRQAVLMKQDKTLQELQEQLERKITDSHSLPKWTDQIIQQHYNDVSHLNEKLQSARDKQEQRLIDALQSKKLKKEMEINSLLEAEAQDEFTAQRLRGAGNASAILSQSYLEQKQRRAMEDMEKDLKIDLEKEKERLNKEMEEELQVELQAQKKSFLAQLAALSKISPDEVRDVVDSAVRDTNANEKVAEKLAKDLRQEIKRAKSSLGVEDDHDEYDNRRRNDDSKRRDEFDNRRNFELGSRKNSDLDNRSTNFDRRNEFDRRNNEFDRRNNEFDRRNNEFDRRNNDFDNRRISDNRRNNDFDGRRSADFTNRRNYDSDEDERDTRDFSRTYSGNDLYSQRVPELGARTLPALENKAKKTGGKKKKKFASQAPKEAFAYEGPQYNYDDDDDF